MIIYHIVSYGDESHPVEVQGQSPGRGDEIPQKLKHMIAFFCRKNSSRHQFTDSRQHTDKSDQTHFNHDLSMKPYQLAEGVPLTPKKSHQIYKKQSHKSPLWWLDGPDHRTLWPAMPLLRTIWTYFGAF